MVSSVLNRILRFIVYNPLVVVVAVALMTAYFAMAIPKVDFSASSDTLMVRNNPDQLFFNKVKEIFGDDQISVICVISEQGIYRRDVLETVRRMTERLENIDGVKEVVSLTNIRNIMGRHTEVEGVSINELETGALIENIPSTYEEWDKLKKTISLNPLYLQNIVAKDGKATSINVVLEQMTEEEMYSKDIVGQIDKVMEEGRKTGLDITATGIPQTKVETSLYMRQDLKRFLPYTLLLIALVLYISFYHGPNRFNPAFLLTLVILVVTFIAQVYFNISWPFITTVLATVGLILFLTFFGGGAILLPLLSAVLTVTWTVGFMYYAGIKFSLINTVMPSLLITICIASVLHVISEYYYEPTGQADPREALIATVKHVSLRVSITSFVTAVAFGSIVVNKIQAIRDMGILAVFGVFVAWLMAMSFIPAMLILMRHKPRISPEVTEKNPVEGKLGRILWRIADWDLRHSKFVLWTRTIMTVVMIPGILVLKIDTDFMSYFHKGDPAVQARDKLISHLAGSSPFFVVIDGHIPDAFLEPVMLKKIESFEKWLATQDGVDTTLSVASYLKLSNRALWSNDPAHFEIPDNRKALAQLFQSLSSTKMLDPYVNKEFSMANVMVRTRIVGSSATLALEKKINEWAEKNFPEAKVTMTGTLYLLNKTADSVSHHQIESTIIETISLFLLMSFFLLSFKLGLLAMYPNVTPICILFGTMGFLSISIDLSTSIIANIIIGLAVDYTIHLLTEFNRKVKKIRDEEESIRLTLATTGRPVTLTAITLFMGFAIVSFSKFRPISHFGELTAFILVVCPLGDLFVLPAILRTVKMITLWDVLDVKLGKDPKKMIKIFEGLSNRQARIAALMGHIHAYNADEGIIAEGDVGSEMFVVITGKVEIYSGDLKERQSIAILGPGDNFGEMAVVRHGFRSASVRAIESTELLILDEGSLQRIKRRYPWIAATIFLNLTRILSDRLQITTVTAMLRGK